MITPTWAISLSPATVEMARGAARKAISLRKHLEGAPHTANYIMQGDWDSTSEVQAAFEGALAAFLVIEIELKDLLAAHTMT